MSTCAEDAALVGPVSLFLGVETATWNAQQLIDCAVFCKEHGITTLFIKVSEVGSKAGDIWYGGIAAWDTIYQQLQKEINVIPYAFIYGDQDIAKEVDIAKQFLTKYQKYCLDMEGSRWSTPDAASRAKQFSDALTPIPGRVFLSCAANPTQSGEMPFVQAMSPCVNVYMPMAYDDSLAVDYIGDFPVAKECVEPTVDLTTEFGPNNVLSSVQKMKDAGILAISLWEYQFATSNPSLVDQIVKLMGGTTHPQGSILITNNGAVLDLRKTYQLEQGETQDACGPFSVAELKYAGLPGHGPTGTSEEIDQWADSEYTKYIGPNVTSDQNGSSIENMHQFAKDANITIVDIAAINPSSKQSDDLARIHRALDAGYPVLATVNELSVKRRDGSNPYPWQPAMGPANHVFTIVGHTNDGYLLVADELNATDNWPDQYSEASIECHWVSVVQIPNWLSNIPGSDPLSWPSGFNAQAFAQPQPTPERNNWVSSGQQQQATDIWNVGVEFVQKVFAQDLIPDSGIYKSWVTEYQNGHMHGFPTTPEVPTVNWNNQKIVVQFFSSGDRCEYDGSAHWYA